MQTPTERLRELGIVLPKAPTPVAAYVPSVRTGNLLYVSGQVPFKDGALAAQGMVPSEVGQPEAKACARQCAINALAVAAAALGSLDKVRRVVRLGVFVASDRGFHQQPQVANGASELMVEVFGEAGKHARAAVGAADLPLGAPVEVEVIFEVE